MSFEISVGDCLAVIELANKLRKRFVGAPDQFKAISTEVRSLSIVLQDVDDHLSQLDLNSQQQKDMSDISDGCLDVLQELEKTLDKYHALGGGNDGNKTKKLWRRLKWEPDEIRELRERVTSNSVLLNTFLGNISSGAIFATKEGVDRLNQRQDDQERQSILNWLTPIDYTSQQNDVFNRLQPGTGQWLLESQQYKTWLQTRGQTLFCPGIPGAGKTVVTSMVVNDLGEDFPNDSSVGIAYIYCNFRRQDEQKIDHLLASLLKQLAQSQMSLPESVRALHEQHRDGTRPPLDKILKSLASVAGAYSRVFVLVDALDECQSSDGCRTRLLSELFDLRTNCEVNVFATSRFIPEITTKFNGCVSLEISANPEDVKRYLDGHMCLLPGFVQRSPDLQEEIKTRIVNAVNGMFLLAQLYFDSLKGKRSAKAVRNALDKLASGSDAYDNAYNGAMERVTGQLKGQKELAEQALSWIIFAKRPLSTTELRHALAVEVGEAELDEENLPEVEDIVSACAGLVTLDEESDVIRLVHYTTQEFFERTQSISKWLPDARAYITTICVTYLSFRVFEESKNPWSLRKPWWNSWDFREEVEKWLRPHPLYDYAAKNWAHHAREVGVSGPTELIVEFLDNKPKVNASFQVLFKNKRVYGLYGQKDITGLHLAAYHGAQDAVALLLRNSNDINAQDRGGQTPLFYAAMNGDAAMVMLLLEHGADLDFKNWRQCTPLHLAAGNGQAAVVKLLLEKGADFNLQDRERQTPLHAAVWRGYTAIIELLLEKGADFNLQEYKRQTPLHMAVWNGSTAIVRLLLEKGVDFNLKDRRHWTPLYMAVSKGSTTIVKLLLEKGADFNLKERDQTPLHEAVSRGYTTIVKLLLEKGADFNLQDYQGQTPLHEASWRGYTTIVELLLEKGADFNLKDKKDRTPLHLAIREGNTAIVKLLLEKGADSAQGAR